MSETRFWASIGNATDEELALLVPSRYVRLTCTALGCSEDTAKKWIIRDAKEAKQVLDELREAAPDESDMLAVITASMNAQYVQGVVRGMGVAGRLVHLIRDVYNNE